MHSIQKDMQEFQRQLQKGSIQKAYRALLDYMRDLRRHFLKEYPGYSISGLYQGYMDMSYFAITPPVLKQRNLKIAIVFNYDAFRFEAWLSASNRRVLREYWELFKDHKFSTYRLVKPETGVDSIVEGDLVALPDFIDPSNMTASIKKKVDEFIEDIESVLHILETNSSG
jgi:hypothetical protein